MVSISTIGYIFPCLTIVQQCVYTASLLLLITCSKRSLRRRQVAIGQCLETSDEIAEKDISGGTRN